MAYDPYTPLALPPGVPPEQLGQVQPPVAPPPQTQSVMAPTEPQQPGGNMLSSLGPALSDAYARITPSAGVLSYLDQGAKPVPPPQEQVEPVEPVAPQPQPDYEQELADAKDDYDAAATGDTLAGLKGGVETVKSLGKMAVAAGADALGFDETAQEWAQAAQENDKVRERYARGRPTDIRDIDSFGSAADWLQYQAGAVAPTILETGLAAVIGGLMTSGTGPGAAVGAVAGGAGKGLVRGYLAKQLAKYQGKILAKTGQDALAKKIASGGVLKAAEILAAKETRKQAQRVVARDLGQGFGVLAASYQMGVGDLYGATVEDDGSGGNAGIAFLTALPYAAAESLVPMMLLGKLKAGVNPGESLTEFAASVGKEGLKAGFGEAGTEAVQEALVLAAEKMDGKELGSWEEIAWQLANAAAVGFAAGGLMGAPVGMTRRPPDSENPAPLDMVNLVQSRFPEDIPRAADGGIEPLSASIMMARDLNDIRATYGDVVGTAAEAEVADVIGRGDQRSVTEIFSQKRMDEGAIQWALTETTEGDPNADLMTVHDLVAAYSFAQAWKSEFKRLPQEAQDTDMLSAVETRQTQILNRISEARKATVAAQDKTKATATKQTEVDATAQEAASSTANDTPEPTESQIKAGNYKKGPIKLHGMDMSVENPQGSTRSGKDAGGNPWSVTMPHHYGYIKGTVGKDKDHLDVFLGPESANADLPVFVVDQNNAKGEFDEHKVMMGFADEASATQGYLSAYADGWQGLGAITPMSMEEFKVWSKDKAKTKKRAAVETVDPDQRTGEDQPTERPTSDTGKAPPAPTVDAAGATPSTAEPAPVDAATSRSVDVVADEPAAPLTDEAPVSPVTEQPTPEETTKTEKPVEAKDKAETQTGEAPAGAQGEGTPEVRLSSGETAKTSSGRTTTPFPRIDDSSNVKAQNTVRRINQWLIDNAVAEAEARGDDFNAPLFKAETAKNLPQGSIDSLNEYLFGEQPDVAPPFTKPLVKPKEEPKTGTAREGHGKDLDQAFKRKVIAQNALNGRKKRDETKYSNAKVVKDGEEFWIEIPATTPESEGETPSAPGPTGPEPTARPGPAGSEPTAPATKQKAKAQKSQATTKKVARLRKAAESASRQAKEKLNPAISERNYTARRARIIEGIAKDGERLQRIARILNGLADDIEAGMLPGELAAIDSRADVEALLSPYVPNPTWGIREYAERDWVENLKGKRGTAEARRRLGSVSGPLTDTTADHIKQLATVSKSLSIPVPADIKATLSSYKRIVRLGITTEKDGTSRFVGDRQKAWDSLRDTMKSRYTEKETAETAKDRRIRELTSKAQEISGFDLFPTPPTVVADMVDMADIPGDATVSLLEPSAGKGAIADAMRDAAPSGVPVDVVEINGTLRELLGEKGHNLVGSDFLEYAPGEKYDRILMNPPFSKNQDIDHVRHAYDLLKPGGRLVSVTSAHWSFAQGKKEGAFRDWVEELDGEVTELSAGDLSDKKQAQRSGVTGRIVVLNKAEAKPEQEQEPEQEPAPVPAPVPAPETEMTLDAAVDYAVKGGLPEESVFEIEDFLPEGKETYTKAEVARAVLKVKAEGTKAKRESAKAALLDGREDPIGLEVKNNERDQWGIVLPDASEPGKFRSQRWDESGFYSHSTVDTAESALDELIADRFTLAAPGTLDRMSKTAKWDEGMARTADVQKANQESWERHLAAVEAETSVEDPKAEAADLRKRAAELRKRAAVVNKESGGRAQKRLVTLREDGSILPVMAAAGQEYAQLRKEADALTKRANELDPPKAATNARLKIRKLNSGPIQGVTNWRKITNIPQRTLDALGWKGVWYKTGQPQIVFAQKGAVEDERNDENIFEGEILARGGKGLIAAINARIDRLKQGVEAERLRDIAAEETHTDTSGEQEPVTSAGFDPFEPFNSDTIEQNPSLKDQGTAQDLANLASKAGWSEEGGRVIRNADGEAIGRNLWVPYEPWFSDKPRQVLEKHYGEAIEKVRSGRKLTMRQREALAHLFEVLNEQQYGDMSVGIDAFDDQNPQEKEVTALAKVLDELEPDVVEELLESAATKELSDDETIRRLKEEIGKRSTPSTPSTEGSGVELFGLATETQEDFSRKRTEDETRRQADLDAERKAQADTEVDDFALSATSRKTDEIEARGQTNLFDVEAKVQENAAPEAVTVEKPTTDAKFSVATGEIERHVSAKFLSAKMAAVLRDWKGVGEVKVVARQDQLPSVALAEFLRVQEGNDDAYIRGAMMKDGTVYLVAENLSSTREAMRVFMHEVVGHVGVRGLFKGALDPLLDEVADTYSVELERIAKRYGLDLEKTDQRREAAEEYIAELAETHQDPNLLRRVYMAIRRFLRSIGVTLRLTDADIDNILMAAKRQAMTGTQQGGARNAFSLAETAGATDADNPDIRFASATPGTAGDPLAEARAQIGKRRTWHDKVKDATAHPSEFVGEKWDNIQQGVLDRFHGLLRAEREVGIDYKDDFTTSSYIAARLGTTIQDALAVLLRHGKLSWDGNILKTSTRKKGFLDALTPVADELEDFGHWLVGLRAQSLMTQKRFMGQDHKKITGFTQPQIDALVALGDGKANFAKARKSYIEFNKSMLNMAQGAGLIDATTRPMWEDDNYLPFYRIMDEGSVTLGPGTGKGLSHQEFSKRFKGSERGIGDPLENIMKNWTHLIDAGLKNKSLKQAVDNLNGTPFMSVAKQKWVPRKFVADDAKELVANLAEDQGLPDEVADVLRSNERLEGLAQLFSMEAPNSPDVVRVMVDGKPKYYKVHDELLLRSLTAINEKQLGKAMELFRIPKRILTQMVTAAPDFMARNFTRDVLSAWVLGRDKFVPGVDGVKGAVKSWNESPEAIALMAANGTFMSGGYLNANDPGAVDRFIRAEVTHANFQKTLLNSPKRLWDFWQRIGAAAENGNRVAVAIASGGPTIKKAFQAKDLMDFSRRGDYMWMKFIAESVPFFNARIQGIDRLRKGFVESPGQFAAKGAMITFAALALYAMNRDDERWKRLEEWDRDSYFHFFVGDEHFRLPKPFEVGVIFGTIPERLADSMSGARSWDVFFQQMRWNATETLNLLPLPQTVAPFIEQWANKTTFTGRPIVGRRIEGLPPEQQYEPWTSDTMRALAGAMGESPKRAEALFRGFFGTIGGYILGVSDIATQNLMAYPDPPDTPFKDWHVVRSFARRDPPRNTRYATEMYNLLKEVNAAHRGVLEARKSGDTNAAAALREEYGSELMYRKMLNRTRAKVSMINRKIRQIYDSRLSPAVKRARIDRLTEKKNSYIEASIKRVRGE